MLWFLGRGTEWRLGVGSGVQGFRRQDSVVGAPDLLGDHARRTASGSRLAAFLGVVQHFERLSCRCVFLIEVRAFGTSNCQTQLTSITMRKAYLSFLTRRAFAPAVVLVIFLLAGLVTFLGEWCARSVALCFSNKSPIFALRRATGIRFTRRSIRARRSWV